MFDFIAFVGFIGFLVFIVMGIVSIFKKNGKAKKRFIIAGVGFVLFVIGAANSPTSQQSLTKPDEETKATDEKKEEADEVKDTQKDKSSTEESKKEAEATVNESEDSPQGNSKEKVTEVSEEETVASETNPNLNDEKEAQSASEKFITINQFKKRVPIGMSYNKYSVDLLEWGQKEELQFMTTIQINNNKYNGEFVDAVVLKDGVLAVGIDGETVTGYWEFNSVDEIRQAMK